MRRFTEALLQSPRARTLEDVFPPALAGVKDSGLEEYTGTFREVLAARLLLIMRKEGLAQPSEPAEAFDRMREALRAVPETQPQGETHGDPVDPRGRKPA